jgi:outer membrane protein TolC
MTTRRRVPCTLAVAALLVPAAAAAQLTPSARTEQQSALAGSVRAGEPTEGTLSLSLEEAVARGLQWNLGVLLSREAVRSAQGQRQQGLSALLPNLSLTSSINLQQVNVRAQEGIQFPGFPSTIGPFANFDARVRLTQSIFDLPSMLRVRAEGDEVQAANDSRQDVREQVVVAVGDAYPQTVAQAARVRSAEAQRDTALALHQQAVDQLTAGTTARIDVLRAQVQLQTEKQRLIAARNDLAKQKLALARLIGLPLEQAFTVTEQPALRPSVRTRPDAALQRAYDERADYRSLLIQTRALETRRRAAAAQSLPAVSLSLDYGAVGVNPASASGTVGGFAGVTIPLFQGGRIRGEVAQAEAALAQSRAQLENLRGVVEQEVRNALLDLQSAAEQVKVATSTVDLAKQTLEQARDRFLAGVADNIEVVQAQGAMASASETLIVSEYMYGLATLQLARATGSAEASLPDLLHGK